MKKFLSNFIENKKVRDMISGVICIIFLIISLFLHDFNFLIYGSLITFVIFFFINICCKHYLKAKIVQQISTINNDYNTIDNNSDIK